MSKCPIYSLDHWHDIARWLGVHRDSPEINAWLEALPDREEALPPRPLEWLPIPAVDMVPINRLRTLADEIDKVICQIQSNEDLMSIRRDLREGIGKLIAIAALDTKLQGE